MTLNGKVGEVARDYGYQRGPEVRSGAVNRWIDIVHVCHFRRSVDSVFFLFQSKALVKMVRVGAPFQYQQFGGLLTIRKFLWTVNFFGRVLLNKLTFGVTPLPVFIQISDADLKYSTALRRADALTAFLWIVTFGLVNKAFGLGYRLKILFGL